MTTKKNRNKYLNDYKNKNYKKYNLIINRKDQDVIDFLDNLPSKTQFVIDVVRSLLDNPNL